MKLGEKLLPALDSKFLDSMARSYDNRMEKAETMKELLHAEEDREMFRALRNQLDARRKSDGLHRQ